MQKTSTKLLMIVITTAAFITAAAATSLSTATPAFAAINCNQDSSVCSGGEKLQAGTGSCGTLTTCNGGIGGRTTVSGNEITQSGGGGVNTGTFSGGIGHHSVCDINTNDCSVNHGGGGGHVK